MNAAGQSITLSAIQMHRRCKACNTAHICESPYRTYVSENLEEPKIGCGSLVGSNLSLTERKLQSEPALHPHFSEVGQME
jgi:hypothetical protein